MRAILLLTILFFPTTVWAFCDNWSTTDTVMESAFVSLTIVDWSQTKEFVAQGTLEEQNPILGKHPSQARIDTYMILAIAAQAGVACWLPQEWREGFLAGSVVIEAWAVNNNLTLGVRGRF